MNDTVTWTQRLPRTSNSSDELIAQSCCSCRSPTILFNFFNAYFLWWFCISKFIFPSLFLQRFKYSSWHTHKSKYFFKNEITYRLFVLLKASFSFANLLCFKEDCYPMIFYCFLCIKMSSSHGQKVNALLKSCIIFLNKKK